MDKTAALVKRTVKELKQWLDAPNAEEWFYLRSIQEIKDMSDETNIRNSILTRFVALNTWYSNNFVYSVLTSETAIDFKVKAAANNFHIVSLIDALAQIYPNNPPKMMFDYSAYYLATVIHMGWDNEAELMMKSCNKALETKTLSGGSDFKMASWFIYEVVNKGFEIDYDYSKFNYPEDMGVYQKALNNWDTKDLELVDEIVSDLCVFHISQASHGSLSDDAGKKDPMFLQFSHMAWFVYAFEVLAWLAMREKQGLKNPDNFSHPLMGIALNQLTKKSIELPDDELFNIVLNKIKTS